MIYTVRVETDERIWEYIHRDYQSSQKCIARLEEMGYKPILKYEEDISNGEKDVLKADSELKNNSSDESSRSD